MKSISLFLFLALTVTALAFGQSTGLKADQNSKEEQALIKLEREWNEAGKNRDKAALERILADDYISTDEAGQSNTKEQYIVAITQNLKVESYTLDDMTVKIYGDTAILIGRWTGTITDKGKDISGVYRFTDTFVKRRGRWVAIATQETRIPKKDS